MDAVESDLGLGGEMKTIFRILTEVDPDDDAM